MAIKETKNVYNVLHYREFCLTFDIECDEELIGSVTDEELIEEHLINMSSEYILRYVEDCADGYFIIIEI